MLESEEQWREQWKDMISNTKALLVRKWFAMEAEDVRSIVDLQITKAYKKAKAKGVDKFVLTPSTIITFTNRALKKEIGRMPGVEKQFERDPETGKTKKKLIYHGCTSLDATTSYEDRDSTPLVDLLESDEPSAFELLEKQEILEEQKKLVLKYMSQRTYDQLVFEYQNHCVTPAHLNFINKLKGIIRNEQY